MSEEGAVPQAACGGAGEATSKVNACCRKAKVVFPGNTGFGYFPAQAGGRGHHGGLLKVPGSWNVS